MFAGGIMAENMSEGEMKKREKGDIRAFQSKLMEAWTAQTQPQDTPPSHTQAPLEQMTALEPGGIAPASLSPSHPFPLFSLHSLPPRHTHTEKHTVGAC